jgi:hypothetical protein
MRSLQLAVSGVKVEPTGSIRRQMCNLWYLTRKQTHGSRRWDPRSKLRFFISQPPWAPALGDFSSSMGMATPQPAQLVQWQQQQPSGGPPAQGYPVQRPVAQLGHPWGAGMQPLQPAGLPASIAYRAPAVTMRALAGPNGGRRGALGPSSGQSIPPTGAIVRRGGVWKCIHVR